MAVAARKRVQFKSDKEFFALMSSYDKARLLPEVRACVRCGAAIYAKKDNSASQIKCESCRK
jgi:hypothetical protein